jgi:hypothetical protein
MNETPSALSWLETAGGTDRSGHRTSVFTLKGANAAEQRQRDKGETAAACETTFTNLQRAKRGHRNCLDRRREGSPAPVLAGTISPCSAAPGKISPCSRMPTK